MIDYRVDHDGIATLIWGMSDRTVSVLDDSTIEEFGKRAGEAAADASVRGVIIQSSELRFVAAMPEMGKQQSAASVDKMRRILRGIETSGKPLVAAINGSALGGGYEICLACHYRIASDNPTAEIGLPDVELGLTPGFGGTQRLPRLIGVRNALPFLLEGNKLRPREATEAGLVDAVVPDGELLSSAKAWILGPRAKGVQPWDTKGFQIPGGPPMSPAVIETLSAAIAMVRARTAGLYPAPVDILSCVSEGCAVDIDTGLKIEQRYFLHALGTPQARNLVRPLSSYGEPNKGLYATRVFSTYINEGLAMLGEGIAPALIENAGRMAGMRAGPLASADDISLDLIQHVGKEGGGVLQAMVNLHGRLGKKMGKGFYDYPAVAKKKLWPELRDHFPVRSDQPRLEELIKRFLYVQSLEAVRCIEEGVVSDARDADGGSVLGWGFCPAMGGVISHIETVGIGAFATECQCLEQAHGERFAAPRLLLDMVAKGESFYNSIAFPSS